MVTITLPDGAGVSPTPTPPFLQQSTHALKYRAKVLQSPSPPQIVICLVGLYDVTKRRGFEIPILSSHTFSTQ